MFPLVTFLEVQNKNQGIISVHNATYLLQCANSEIYNIVTNPGNTK